MSSICSTVRSGNLFHKLWYKNVNGKRSKGNSNSSSRKSTKVQRSCSRTLMRTWVAYLPCSAGAQKSTGRSNHQSDPRKSCALHQQCLFKSTSAYHNRQRTSRMILKCASYSRQCFGTSAREDRMRRTPNHNSADPIRHVHSTGRSHSDSERVLLSDTRAVSWCRNKTHRCDNTLRSSQVVLQQTPQETELFSSLWVSLAGRAPSSSLMTAVAVLSAALRLCAELTLRAQSWCRLSLMNVALHRCQLRCA